jgi:hypothetical protein
MWRLVVNDPDGRGGRCSQSAAVAGEAEFQVKVLVALGRKVADDGNGDGLLGIQRAKDQRARPCLIVPEPFVVQSFGRAVAGGVVDRVAAAGGLEHPDHHLGASLTDGIKGLT